MIPIILTNGTGLGTYTTNIPSELTERSVNWEIILTEGKFDWAPSVTFTYNNYGTEGTKSYDFVLSGDKMKATLVVPQLHIRVFDYSSKVNVDFSIKSTIKPPIEPPIETPIEPTIEPPIEGSLKTLDLNNCTTDIPKTFELLEVEGDISTYYEVKDNPVNWTVFAEEGFTIQVEPTLTYNSPSGENVVIKFKISKDGKKANYSGDLPPSYGKFFGTLLANAVFVNEEIDGNGSVIVYSLTLDDLGQFAKARFFEEEVPNILVDSSGLNTVTSLRPVDLGDYVHSLKMPYFEVKATSPTTKLYCGNYNTNVLVGVIENAQTTLDFGSVLLPQYNGSSSDYTNTTIEMFIPFVGYRQISTDYLNTSIRLIYKIDNVTSCGVALLYSNEMLIETINCTPFKEIIYRKNDENSKTMGDLDKNFVILYGLQPYIKMKWYNLLENNVYKSENKRDFVKNMEGWVKLENVEYNLIDDSIGSSEVDMLNEALLQGVQILK